MTEEQAEKFWEPVLAIMAYAGECKEKLEEYFYLPEEENSSQIPVMNSQQDALFAVRSCLHKIKERVAELEELLLSKEETTEG